MTRIVLVDRGHLKNFITPITTFDGWSVLHEAETLPGQPADSDVIVLRVENPTLLDYIRNFRPAWATVAPPLGASVDRAPVKLRQLAGGKLKGNARTIRDLVADLLDDEDFE